MQKFSSYITRSVIVGLLIALTYLTWSLYRHPPSRENMRLSYAPAVGLAAPSVVSILSESEAVSAEGLWSNPLFSEYSDRLRKPPKPAPRLGSGVIIDHQGHVLTNYHVVKSTRRIQVNFVDGTIAEAMVLAADPASDLAVLKLPPAMSKPIVLAATGPRAGDIVLAIGNAYGVGQAVSQGIISGLGRSSLGLANIENFIQTDAAVSPGSSGGALINTDGELVGIVTALFSTDGTYQGISFAIPALSALRIADELISKGKVVRGYLGVEMHALTAYEADFFGLNSTNGMLITGVHKNSPAEKTGLEPGDVLLKINGATITSAQQGQQLVSALMPGTTIKLSLFRRGQVFDAKPTVTDRPLQTDLNNH